jgi:hypothetical protein
MKSGVPVVTLSAKQNLQALRDVVDSDDEEFVARAAAPVAQVPELKGDAAAQGTSDEDFYCYWVFLAQLSAPACKAASKEIIDCYGSGLLLISEHSSLRCATLTDMEPLFLSCFTNDGGTGGATDRFIVLLDSLSWLCSLSCLLQVLHTFGPNEQLTTPSDRLRGTLSTAKTERPLLFVSNEAVHDMAFLLDVVRASYEGATVR